MILITEAEGIQVRTGKLLMAAGIETLEDLTEMTLNDVKKIRGMGRRGIDEISFALDCEGLKLKEE